MDTQPEDGQVPRWVACTCIECRNGHPADCPFEGRRLVPVVQKDVATAQ